MAHGSAARARKKRMLIIVNPYATTVSDRLKNLVVYALQGRYDVEAVSTEAQHHAIEIGREAREGGYDVVVAFGGDGTLNEVANGLAGTEVPVSVLPGGSTNVVCRTLGIPNDVVDATEHLLGLADDFRPRKIDLGLANGRHFVFACGAGLDATAAKRVDSSPRLKARGGRWFYTWAAVSGFYTHYLRDPIRMRLDVDGSAEGVTAIIQNSDPFTYFGSQPLRVCEGAALDNGTLSAAMLGRAAQRDVPIDRGAGAAERPSHHRTWTDKSLRGRHRGPNRVDLTRRRGRHPPLPGPGGRGLHRRSSRARDRHRARRADDRCLSRRRCPTAVASARSSPATRPATSSSRTKARSPSSTTGRCSRATRCSSPATITKRIWDLPDGLLATLFANARLVSSAIRAAMGAQGAFIALNNVVSQSVPHVHVHLVPRNRKDGLSGFFWPRTKYDGEDHARETAEAIRAAVASIATLHPL